MQIIATIGLEIAKQAFQVHGAAVSRVFALYSNIEEQEGCWSSFFGIRYKSVAAEAV